MTEEPDMNLPEQPEVKGDAAKVMRWINLVVMSFGVVFAFSFWTDWKEGYRKSAERLEALQSTVAEMKGDARVLEANRDVIDTRFNSTDGKLATLDRRVEKVEDSNIANRESLKRIENKIGSNPTGNQ